MKKQKEMIIKQMCRIKRNNATYNVPLTSDLEEFANWIRETAHNPSVFRRAQYPSLNINAKTEIKSRYPVFNSILTSILEWPTIKGFQRACVFKRQKNQDENMPDDNEIPVFLHELAAATGTNYRIENNLLIIPYQ